MTSAGVTGGPRGHAPGSGYLSAMSSAAPHPPVRLVIIDDHQMVLDGLQAMLRPYRDQVEVVGESSDARAAAELVAEVKPDAVLLDVRLRGTSGLDLCTEILSRVPGCKVVFLTVYDDEQYLFQALRVGAAGFLLKRIRGGELVDHLSRICEGEVLIDPALAGRVALSAARLRSGEFWPGAHLGLTHRESEVLALQVAGLTNRAIAAKLVVSEETVKTHSRGVYRKLGVSDRAGAVAAALREGVFR
jgi:DNA-binding NarL/FixJ family response regulator